MEKIVLKSHAKIRLSELKSGDTFRLISKGDALMVIDITSNDLLENEQPVLRPGMVYYVDLMTGIVEAVGGTLEVYQIKLNAEEVI